MSISILPIAVFFAGFLQIGLVLASLLIPKLLNWKGELDKVSPLIRQMFWTYAGYILFTNLSFGILSAIAPEALIDGSVLATAVTLYIFCYWAARIIIQFTYFDRSQTPQGGIYFWGEIVLVSMFVLFTGIYGYALYVNLTF